MKNDKEKLIKTDGGVIASPWLRFGGWAVDFLLWLAVWLVAVWWLATADTLTMLLDSLLIVVPLGMAGLFVNLLVTAGFTYWFGGTVGKLTFGIEVVDEEGKRLSFWRALWREWFGKMVSGMALWLGFIWILIDKDRRGWHDMMAGSRVVVKRENLLLQVGGLVTILAMFIVNTMLINNIWREVKSDIELYQQIIDDIGG